METPFQMAPPPGGESCCSAPKAVPQRPAWQYAAILAAAVLAWVLVYRQLDAAASWLTFDLMGLEQGSRMGDAVHFFLYDTPKVMLLLVMVVFSVGVLRSFFTPEAARKMLSGKRQLAGNFLAAGLGAVTPFCSCSAVPLFIGFVSAGVPLGITLSFLITAPMVNELALGMLFALFGFKVAALYLIFGMLIAVTAGWVLGHMGLEKDLQMLPGMGATGGGLTASRDLTLGQRLEFGREQVKDIVGSIWPYILGAVAVGSLIHGYVPQDSMEALLGESSWWSVPLAVVVGVPMYGNCVGAIPVMEALITKGAAMGTVLAFVMSVASLSLPEAVILRRVMKPRLIAVFFGIVTLGILFTGYMFNLML